MNPYILFLLKSGLSLSVFYFVFILGIQRTRNFRFIRHFLLSALILSVGLSLVPITYKIALVDAGNEMEITHENNGLLSLPNLNEIPEGSGFSWHYMFFALYVLGVLFLLLRLIIQFIKLMNTVRTHGFFRERNIKIVNNTVYPSCFSLFNYVFINKNIIKSTDYPYIIAHEEVHVLQRHWLDLLLVELCVIICWVNPFVWLYARAIRQNHEYLADQGVVEKGNSLARYQAVILNQLMGVPLVRLSNPLNFSINTKRLNMMKTKVNSKKGFVNALWGVPAIAILVVAFARPEYVRLSDETNFSVASANGFQVERSYLLTGKVVEENGEPLPGANIVIEGTSLGTVADRDGTFSINIAKKDQIVVSFVGYSTEKQSIVSLKEQDEGNYQTEIKLKRGRVSLVMKLLESAATVPPPPPPPPPKGIDPDVEEGEEEYVVVEDIPHYPGGIPALADYLRKRADDYKKSQKVSGNATIGYTINTKGSVTNIQVLDADNDAVAKAGVSIVSGFEIWQPGSQRGKNVNVDYALRLVF